MAYALAYLGSLGFIAFWVWLNRQNTIGPRIEALEEQVGHLHRTLDEVGKSHLKTNETVSTLALAAGLKDPKKRAA